MSTFLSTLPAVPFYVNEVYRVVKENHGLEFKLSVYSMHQVLHALGVDETSHVLIIGSGSTGVACLHAAAMYRVQQVVGLDSRRYAWKESLSHLRQVLARGLLQSPVFLAHSKAPRVSTPNLFSPFTHVLVLDAGLFMDEADLQTALENSATVTQVVTLSVTNPQPPDFTVRLYGSDVQAGVYVWRRALSTSAAVAASALSMPVSSLPFFVDWNNVAMDWCSSVLVSDAERVCSRLSEILVGGIRPENRLLAYLMLLVELTGEALRTEALRTEALRTEALRESSKAQRVPSSFGGHVGYQTRQVYTGVSDRVFYYNGSTCEGVPLGQSVDQSLPNVFMGACPDAAVLPAVVPLFSVVKKSGVLSRRERDWLTLNFGVLRGNQVSSKARRDFYGVHVVLTPVGLMWYRPFLSDVGTPTSYVFQNVKGGMVELYSLVYNLQTW